MNWRIHAAAAAYNITTGDFEYVCPEGDCVAMGDGFHMYTLIIKVPASMDANGDGLVSDFAGYTDPAGRLITDGSCTTVSAICVPTRAQNVAVGTYLYDMKAPFVPGTRVWGDGVVTTGVRQFDITPPGVPCESNPAQSCSWITLPPVEAHTH